VLGIRVGVPHLTEFDVGGVRGWRGGFGIGGGGLRSVQVPGEIDGPVLTGQFLHTL